MPRPGHTLLELIVASTILAVTLVPALVLFRDSIFNSQRLEDRELLTTLAVGKMEETLAILSADKTWALTGSNGTFSTIGYPRVRFTTTRTDDSAALTQGGKLMAVVVTVWNDENNDAAQQSSEASLTLRTKVGQLAAYQNVAAGS